MITLKETKEIKVRTRQKIVGSKGTKLTKVKIRALCKKHKLNLRLMTRSDYNKTMLLLRKEWEHERINHSSSFRQAEFTTRGRGYNAKIKEPSKKPLLLHEYKRSKLMFIKPKQKEIM